MTIEGLTLGFGLLAGMFLAERSAHDPGAIRRLWLAGSAGAIAGGRLGVWWSSPADLQWQTLTSWGAMAGFAIGAFGYLLATRRLGRLWPLADTVAPALGVTVLTARIGCLLAGCRFGHPTTLPWGVRYGPDTLAFQVHGPGALPEGASMATPPLHPAALYESLAIGAALIVWWLSRKTIDRWPDGSTLILGLAGYGLILHLVESASVPPWTMTHHQIVGSGLLAASLVLVLLHRLPAGVNRRFPSRV